MGLNWTEIDKETQSSFLKLLDGDTKTIEFVTEPEKYKDSWGKTKYESKVMVDGQLLTWGFAPMLLKDIGDLFGKPDSLVKKVLVLSRAGTGKDDTRYSVDLPQPVDAPVVGLS